ncbi:MAG: R3H domain-containing nucleic acid-binding protein [Actinomycetota bacterium]
MSEFPEATNEVPVESPDEANAAAAEGVDDSEDSLLDDQADLAEDFLDGLLDVLDLDGEATAEFAGDTIEVELTGPDLGLLIGRHGATLEALQDLVRTAVQHQTESRVLLTLDIGGYRTRQRAVLERRASSVAAEVRAEGKSVELEPMSAFERKVVHNALANTPGVGTRSEGEGSDRHIVVYPS